MTYLNEFIENTKERLYQEGRNNQGDMQIIEYNDYDDNIVKFLDGSGYQVHTQYSYSTEQN